MDYDRLREKLDELLALPAETEWVEFKAARSNLDSNDLGKYFSALCNEANLKNQPYGWLVLGVSDATLRQALGTRFRATRRKLDSLKKEVADHTTGRITFIDIHEVPVDTKRVLLFQVPPAPRGMPVAWKGHYYGRDGESLVPLNIQEIEQIRSQVAGDWSAQVCRGATLDALDPRAVAKARSEYKIKNPDTAPDVDTWNDPTFLNKAKVLIEGKLTHTAILLLGKAESEHFLSPGVGKITWVLEDSDGAKRDYQHFGPPFLLNTDQVFAKIRNLRYRYLRDDTLFPMEVTQYEPWVIREALHNCIAHQDYARSSRISVVEKPDSLLLTNAGSFIPGTVEHVIEMDAPPARYRNPFLAGAMVRLNMIDTVGGGIRRMFLEQRKRFFPLPNYDLTDPQSVKVGITGKVLDENYTRMLITRSDLDLWAVIALDKVQKGIPVSDPECRLLRSKGLVEGRRPNLYVTATVATATGKRASYIRNRAFDKDHYKKMLLAYLREYGSASREDVDALLLDKLSDALTTEQKRTKVRNLLQEMRRKDRSIYREGARMTGRWLLAKN